MIDINIDVDEIKRLTNDLKEIKRVSLEESNWAVKTMYKNINDVYTKSIDELVYEQYQPDSYERTFHLRGKHGAMIEDFKVKGFDKYYWFEIDGNSRDPIDGETWFEKARKIENGYEEMAFKKSVQPFNRPFIEEVQDRMFWEASRTSNEAIRVIEKTIDKAVGG